MTRSGEAFERLTWELRTEGFACSSSRGRLPTPTAADGEGGRHSTPTRPTLGGEARLLPTAVVTDSAGARNSTSRDPNAPRKGSTGDTLTDALCPRPGEEDRRPQTRQVVEDEEVATLLPTPNPFHAGNTEEPDAWRERRADVFERTGTRHGPALSVIASSIAEGDPLTPDRYMPDGFSDVDEVEDVEVLLPSPVASEGTKPSNTMGVARRAETGQVFLTNVIVTLEGLDPSEAEDRLLPTPLVSDLKGTSPNDSFDQLRGIGDLLPTPTTQETHSGPSQTDRNTPPLNARVNMPDFGAYAPAIRRWERVLGRPAPAPTEVNSKGNPRLSPAFVEWMMGLPAGHVTGSRATRAEQLKALGNGVVPQQAGEAFARILDKNPDVVASLLEPVTR